ncbi:MAG: hypothetical protein WKF29_08930 [Thermoleophilaceae bacterium]
MESGAGHYESLYLKACHPSEPIGLWVRYTVHKRPDAAPTGSLWFTLFGADGPRAVKQTFDRVHVPADAYIAMGESVFSPVGVRGSAEGEGRRASWELSLEGSAEPFRHLPSELMYRAPLPRTKLLSPHPDLRFSGRAEIDGHGVELEGWRGMVGHNWGAQHAERWIWMHGAGFAENESAWFDAALGRIKVGPLTTPWIANAVLSFDGERHRLGGPVKVRSTEVREVPERCEFVLTGDGITVQGTAGSERERFVGWVYADPDGSEHHAVNCSIADMELAVSRPGRPPLSLRVEGGAAYELGMREHDHGVTIQPFADG